MADYGSVAEVVPFVRHLLDGAVTFGSTTTPTVTVVNQFLTYASAMLNSALAEHGFSVPMNTTSNSTANAQCDLWVSIKAAQMCEYTQRGSGFDSGDDQRYFKLVGLSSDPSRFVRDNALGWKRGGATVSHALSEGLKFTGETVQSDRTDPDDTSLEQPFFIRGQFDA